MLSKMCEDLKMATAVIRSQFNSFPFMPALIFEEIDVSFWRSSSTKILFSVLKKLKL